MNMIRDWPPCQVLYLMSLRTLTNSAIVSYERLVEQQESDKKESLAQQSFLDELQNIVQQGAAISRYFWPSKCKDKKKNDIFQSRALFLKHHFGVSDSSTLKDRSIRNAIEHFDERLDMYLQTPISGHFCPNYIGKKPQSDRGVYKFFRAFFTDTQEFEIFGEAFLIHPLIEEIIRIDQHVRYNLENGGTMPLGKATTEINKD